MDVVDLECCAEELYAMAGLDRDDVVRPSTIARKVLGPSCVIRVRMLAMGRLSWVDGEAVIAVRKGLSEPIEEHTIGHELGHWILRRNGYAGDYEEACADFIGAALVAPRIPFAERARQTNDFKQLAFDFAAPETLVALRFGEVLNVPVAVITPREVYARGEARWPHKDKIRGYARNPIAGMRKVRLTDAYRRTALVVDSTG